MRNPYICGGWVTGANFYGHQELVQEIAGGQVDALYILGGRRSGKTSLLRRVEEVCIKEERPCLFLDLQTTGRTIDGLFRVMQIELRGKARYWTHLFSSDLLTTSDLLTLLDMLANRTEMEGIELLMLLDEAEVLLEMASTFPVPLTRLWEIIRGSATIKIAVAASRVLMGIDQILPGSRSTHSFLRGFQQRYLTRLDKTSAEALVRQTNSSPPVWVVPHLLNQIQEVTGCHAYLLQLLGQRLYQPDHSLRSLTNMDLAVDELLGTFLNANYNNLLSEERELLWIIAEQAGADVTALQLASGLSDDRVNTCLDWLLCLGHIQIRSPTPSDREGGQYYVGNRFLASWMSSHREGLQDTPASQDPMVPLGEIE